ncbi:aminoglycoside phosphotransferase (APT) family kinase protein [Paraburkholderia unamae]|uniref:phosphotransferase family protein n=1 Tax=Paraburkholderia unamae TaxID=219649 RepID=UPI000DC4EA22|nr:phosphotransferase family protein [Paraburkholderia unamae]RAR57912.1 aminoglycoside phosphotransferase (APT) family kinase protein [Paraburkholderia unamae]
MLIPAQRIWSALSDEVAKLQAQFADSDVDGSAVMAISNGLRLLRNREAGGVAALRVQCDGLDGVLAQLEVMLGMAGSDVMDDLRKLRTQLDVARAQTALPGIEAAWLAALGRLQALMARVNQGGSLAPGAKKAVARILTDWETAHMSAQGAASACSGGDAGATQIDAQKLEAYLCDRFDEPALRVTSFRPLAGGFGKQTILFDVAGEALSGAFVMRRDMSERPSVEGDCHRTRDEYPVLRAMRARGFPAPEALWVDTAHRLLPGGDFIVMRCSPGKLSGSVFGVRAQVPESLTVTLADTMAHLHTMAPLVEVGELTDSLCAEGWKRSRGACTARYVRNLYELYLEAEHTPSPALVAIYGWLLDNVPDRKGPPSMLHGDFGFHNFLFEGDRLSAVLDWEFAHAGDPAEDLGYVHVTVGAAIDWARMMERYVAGGGEPVDDDTLRFFRVWAYVRNATGANLHAAMFSSGRADDLKLAILPVSHIPQFIRCAQALIDEA